jgi:hypothetical protein
MSARLETNRLSAWLPWSLAFAVSIVAHVGVFRLNPDLMIGQPPLRPSTRTAALIPATQMEELRIREIQQELPRLLDAFPQVDRPGELNPSPLEIPAAGEIPSALLTTELPKPRLEMASLPPSERAPELAEPPSDWQPRTEVLAITDQRVTETLDFLPKVIAADEKSPLPGPDIRLPSEQPPSPAEAGRMAFAPAPAPAFAAAGLGGDIGLPGLPDLLLPGLGGTMSLPETFTPALEQLPDEKPENITRMEAVETLLRIDTRSYVDPAQPAYRYFKLQIMRDGIEALPVLPRDVVFLVDASASMTQEKVDMAVQGVRDSLETLSPEDHFNVLIFRERVELWSPASMPADTVRKAGARTFLSNVGAYGRTDVFASLETLRSLDTRPERPMIGVLVTDGVPTQGVTDTHEILERFTRANDGVISVFGVGSGRRVNRLLLDFLGFRNRGDVRVVDRNRDLPQAVVRLSEQVARPVLSHLAYRFTETPGLEVYPRRLSHLYLDHPLILLGRVPVEQKEVAFQMIGRSLRGEHDLVFRVNLDEAPHAGASLRREWAWQAILEDIALSISDPNPRHRARVRSLSTEHGIEVPSVYSLE